MSREATNAHAARPNTTIFWGETEERIKGPSGAGGSKHDTNLPRDHPVHLDVG